MLEMPQAGARAEHLYYWYCRPPNGLHPPIRADNSVMVTHRGAELNRAFIYISLTVT